MNKYNKFTICKLIIRYLTIIITFVLITKVINNNKNVYVMVIYSYTIQ